MKAVKIDNNWQLFKEVPNAFKSLDVYNVIRPEIRPNQKYVDVQDSLIDEELKTLTIQIEEMSKQEYKQKLMLETPVLIERLKNIVFILESGAKEIAIGKEGSIEYISSQERLYLHKYKIAKNELPDINNLLQNEANNVGVSFEDYKLLIIEKYEAGQQLFDSFLSMIECSRIKALGYIDSLKNHKANELLDLMGAIKSTMSIQDIQNQMSIILNYQ